jgi:hypothetical protein
VGDSLSPLYLDGTNDHEIGPCPLLLDSGEGARWRSPCFYFEKGWLERTDFVDLVTAKWHSLEGLGGPFHDPIDAWQHVSSGLRQFLKGWGANIGKEDRDLDDNILGSIQALDVRADTTGLDDDGWALSITWKAKSPTCSRLSRNTAWTIVLASPWGCKYCILPRH